MHAVNGSLCYTTRPTEQPIFYTNCISVATAHSKYTRQCEVGSLKLNVEHTLLWSSCISKSDSQHVTY
jgi:hypothetical protein